MNVKIILSVLLTIFLINIGFSQDTITQADAEKFIGKSVVLIGKVEEIAYKETAIFLNFGDIL